MKKYCLLIILLPLLTIAQQRSLHIGDITPNEQWQTLKKIISSSGDEGKLVILDFFATWCTACIRELPKLDSLQNLFTGRLQIILIAGESKEKLDAFRKKNQWFASSTLPVIASDTLWTHLFPHKYVPHEVWINANGKVIAITDPLPVTAENISASINGIQLHLPVKKDNMTFDYRIPLFQNDNAGNEESLLYRSLIGSRIKDMGSSSGCVRDSTHARYYYINNTILNLYKTALGFAANRVVLQVADTSSYILPLNATEEWKDKNLFTYELTVPRKTTIGEVNGLFVADLDRYFNLHGRMENRTVTCWALVSFQPSDSIFQPVSLGNNKPSFTEQNGNYILTNQSVSSLVNLLNAYRSPVPGKPIILDETGNNHSLNIQIPYAAIGNIEWLQKILSPYSLHLVPVERRIEMFVLTELIAKSGKPNQ